MQVTVPRLSVGVLTADLTRLGAELEILRGKAEWAHLDVMDGAFCPQLTFGPAFVAAIASAGIAVDAHLMVTEPRRLLPEIAAAGASVITVHAEATRHLHRTMQEMTELAGQSRTFLRGVAINPGTPVQAIEPVLELADLILVLAVNPGWSGQAPAANTRSRTDAVRAMADRCGADVLVGVDGGVTIGNAAQIASWGVDVIVSGSAVFDRVDPAGNLDLLLRQLRQPRPDTGRRQPDVSRPWAGRPASPPAAPARTQTSPPNLAPAGPGGAPAGSGPARPAQTRSAPAGAGQDPVPSRSAGVCP